MSCHATIERSDLPERSMLGGDWVCPTCHGDLSRPLCECGHLRQHHELRGSGMLGCIIWECLCIDFTPTEH